MIIHDLDAMPMSPIGLSRRDAALDSRGRPYLVTRMVLVHSDDDGWVAIDTGIGEQDALDPRRRLGLPFTLAVGATIDASRTLKQQALARNIDPREIKHVVLTHLDVDHAGGLPDFPWAKVHAHPREIATAANPKGAVQRGRYRRPHFEHGPDWCPFGEPTERWHGLDTGPIDGLSDRWKWVALHGHTPGHCGIVWDDDDGDTHFHVGDAFLQFYEMKTAQARASLANRFHHIAFDDDSEKAVACRRALRRIWLAANGGKMRWYSGHDPTVLVR
jgi:glyoxylase-like metal-dependent hydrolase (beta-lactamase superfamily II)